MRTVWKTTLRHGTPVHAPGDKVVHVGMDPATDGNTPTVWTEVDPDAPTHIWLVFVGTGQPIPANAVGHVGSTITSQGLVWHVYEVTL